MGGRRQGKSEMARIALDAALKAGKSVAVLGTEHSTLHRRVKRNGKSFDVLTPISHGHGSTFVSMDELGKFGVPDVPDDPK